MSNNILNQQLISFRAQVDQIVLELHELTNEIGHAELAKTVSDLRNRLHEPFMFVIVGEVKAGKSSFINALLDTGKEICKVAPSPMTDTIQQIIYGDQESTTEINPYLKQIFQPVDILKEIAIVDTPGTNTIVEHHQEITESFIPASDLIVFVFEAKNPYRQSAWAFFDFIHEDWRRKIIFVLQQKDLMSPEDLAINEQGVRDHALKKGINEPLVYAVSAKEELDGLKEQSGFKAIREYIRQNITGGKAPLLKLHNNLETSSNINERIFKGLLVRREQWEADIEFRHDIRNTLDEQEQKSRKQVDVLVENLLAAYDRISGKTEDELSDGLSFFTLMRRSFSALFNRQKSAKEWLNGLATGLEEQLNTELKAKLDDGVVDIADSIQQMAKIIHLKIENSSTILKNNHDIFSDIAEKRASVLQDLQATFARFMKKNESFTDDELFPDKNALSPNLATGSGLAVVGVILTAVANGAVFDITGGILTTVGLLFAGVSVGLQKRKIINGYQAEIAKGRLQMEEEVSNKLKTYIQHIKIRIDDNFDNFDDMLQQEEKQIANLQGQQQNINNRLNAIKNQLQAMSEGTLTKD
ncbi:MAG: dynamin family protein [Bacteroidota bacterium]